MSEKKPKKVIVNKRERKATQSKVRKIKTVDDGSNPLLSKAPKSSIAAKMIAESNERARSQNEASIKNHKAHGISIERDMRLKEDDSKSIGSAI